MTLSHLHCALIVAWLRENITPEQRVQLQAELPLGYAAMIEGFVNVEGGISANINAAPLKRPSARRIR